MEKGAKRNMATDLDKRERLEIPLTRDEDVYLSRVEFDLTWLPKLSTGSSSQSPRRTDLRALRRSVWQIVRDRNLGRDEACGEFFKLALEAGRDIEAAWSIRTAVRILRTGVPSGLPATDCPDRQGKA